MERRTKRPRPDDPEDSVQQHAKKPKLDDYEAPVERHADRLWLTDSKHCTSNPRKASIDGSLFTALNRPLYVPLLQLPPELRNGIWKYALYMDMDDGFCILNEDENFPEPALLSTCRQIRREAMGIFYSENIFAFTVTSYSPKMPMFTLKKMVSLRKRYGISIAERTRATFQGPPRWNNLLSWIKAVHETPCGSTTITAHRPHRFTAKSTDGMNANQLRRRKESNFLAGLFRLVCEMKDRPWHIVESSLAPMRYGLELFDPEWAKD